MFNGVVLDYSICRVRMEAAMATVIGSPVGVFARLNSSGRSEIFGNGLGFVRFPSLSHVPIRVRMLFSLLYLLRNLLFPILRSIDL